jgi:hypothetical protein
MERHVAKKQMDRKREIKSTEIKRGRVKGITESKN